MKQLMANTVLQNLIQISSRNEIFFEVVFAIVPKTMFLKNYLTSY